MPSIEPTRGPSRGPRRSRLPDVAPGPGWRRSPSGVWLPPYPGEVAEASAYNLTVVCRPQRPVSSDAIAATNPLLYFKSSAATAYQNATGTPPGTTLVTATTQDVATWRDSGSAGAHATQTTAGTIPTVGQLSPLRVRLDGSNDRLLYSGSVGVSGAQSFACKFKLRASLASNTFNCIATVMGTSTVALIYLVNFSGWQGVSLVLGAASGSSATYVGWSPTFDLLEHTLLVQRDAGGTYTIDYDGSPVTVVSSGSSSRSTTSSAIGAESNGSWPINADLGPVVYWDRQLTSGERTSVNTALLSAST